MRPKFCKKIDICNGRRMKEYINTRTYSSVIVCMNSPQQHIRIHSPSSIRPDNSQRAYNTKANRQGMIHQLHPIHVEGLVFASVIYPTYVTYVIRSCKLGQPLSYTIIMLYHAITPLYKKPIATKCVK